MTQHAKIILADDDDDLRTVITRLLHREGFQVIAYADARAALAAVLTEKADLLLTDLNMPDMNGLELVQQVKAQLPHLEIIMLTGEGTIDRAVEAMRLGAYDFIQKPIDLPVLCLSIRRALEKRQLVAENHQLRQQLTQQQGETALIGNSPALLEIKKLLRQIGPTDVSVLIQGESGTGKEVVADLLHALSPRRDHPLVKISCAAIPETLLESELFGYEKGAFTGAVHTKPGKLELAQQGTLFLDEIAEMSTALQAKLLRVLQDHRFQRVGGTTDLELDARILSATHVDLPRAIEEKKFRLDLYYRLKVVQVTLPPLRVRREDIPLLTQHLLAKHVCLIRREVPTLTPAGMKQLLAYPWPGNVRELENVIQSALAMATGNTIETFTLDSRSIPPATPPHPIIPIPVGSTLEEAERLVVIETLKQFAGDKEKTAQVLGLSLRSLYRHLPEK